MKRARMKRALYLPLILTFVCVTSFFIIQFILNLAGITIGFRPEHDAHEMWYVP